MTLTLSHHVESMSLLPTAPFSLESFLITSLASHLFYIPSLPPPPLTHLQIQALPNTPFKQKIMSRATIELDFFGMEKENSSSSTSQFQKFLQRRRSFCDIQSAISKINPELIKSVIASGSANQIDSKKPLSVPGTPTDLAPTALPALSQVCRTAENIPETAPFTIFYNGTVSVFNIPRDKAESILKLAVKECPKKVEPADSEIAVPASNEQQLIVSLNEDLPIARRKSLQRFLAKRKERMVSVMPYACSA